MAIVVKRGANDNDDKLISKFRQMVLKYKVIDEYKDRMFYMKPSTKKKLAKKNAKANRRRIRVE